MLTFSVLLWRNKKLQKLLKIGAVFTRDPIGKILGSITSRCSGKEPALLPRTRLERAAEIEPRKIRTAKMRAIACN